MHHQYERNTIHHQHKKYTIISWQKTLINSNVGSDGTINNGKLTDLKAESEAGHECNINDITQVNEYKSPGKKDASTINDSAYYNSDYHEDEISDSNKQVEASKEPITDTHIFDRVCNLLDGIVSVKPAVTGVGIVGRGGRGITQGVISGGTRIISSNVITDVLTDSSKMILKSDLFPLDPF